MFCTKRYAEETTELVAIKMAVSSSSSSSMRGVSLPSEREEDLDSRDSLVRRKLVRRQGEPEWGPIDKIRHTFVLKTL